MCIWSPVLGRDRINITIAMAPSRKERLIGEMISFMNRGNKAIKQPSELIAPTDVETHVITPVDPISPQRRAFVDFVERQSSFKLRVVNKRPALAGFFICPEHERAISILANIHPSLNNNRGKALEYLVEFYLGSLPDDRREEFIELIAGALKM
jgi:hypothetical protein